MKPTTDDIVEINQVLALLGHIMDSRAYHRLSEVMTPDAFYDCTIFGFGTATAFDAIAELMGRDGHAIAHHCTNVYVHEGQGDSIGALSKGLGVLKDGGVASITFVDTLLKTGAGWRISSHVLAFNTEAKTESR